MWSHPRPDFPKSASPPRRAPRAGPRRPLHPKLSLEALEDRSLPSVAPLPIPGGVLIPNPFGGPDVHANLPGPVDSTVPGIGGEPSTITDFNGFVGVVVVDGTGTDGRGNRLLWAADLGIMKGVSRGADGHFHEGAFALV